MEKNRNRGLSKDIFASIVLGLYFSVTAINQSLLAYIPRVAGFSLMSFLYLVLGIVLLFIVLIKFISNYTIYKTHFVCLIILLMIYGVTSIHIERSTLDILEFLLYVFFPVLFVSKINIDIKSMVKAGVIAPFFSVFNLNSIFALREYTENISMGTSYAFLFSILCAISYLLKYYREERKRQRFVMLPFLVIDFIIMVSVFMHGSRGPLLCIITAVLLFTLFEVKNCYGVKIKNKKLLFALIILLLIVLFFFWDILNAFNSLLIKNGYNINFIRKLVELKGENDVLNGRLIEYSYALKGIVDRPFFGHGMSTFTFYTGYAYPHNFILQLIYDAGFLGFMLFLVPFLLGARRFYRFCDLDDFILGVILFSYAIPSSLFTGDLWKKPVLWGLFSFALLFISKSKNQTIDRKELT